MAMPYRIPPFLTPGDRLIAVAPSGTLRETTAFEQGVAVWRDRGYDIELAQGYDDRWGYLAGKDEDRRRQLAQAWTDPDCKGVVCVRGGWGAARLLEQWIWPTVVPKWLIGFSDITALLWSLGLQGISGVHGPLLTTLAQEPDWSCQRLFDWLEGREIEPLQGQGWGQGVTQGYLLPANLTVATHLLHTPLQPPLTDVILALEDVGEAPYRLDRLLTQWRMAGLLAQVKGIALGRFSRCQPPADLPSLTVEQVLRDRLRDLGVPIVSGLPFGHDGVNAALPVGQWAELNGETGRLAILSPRTADHGKTTQ
jgi:muramoyltetrapeptide carboxypeptidase